MTPTPEQKQWLKEYLYEALSYRETYDEVYDHILLALENKPAQEFFESNVYQIIDEDFGGSINMLNMEVDCKTVTDKEVKTQYWRTFISWFTTPLVAYTAAIFVFLFLISGIKSFAVAIGMTVIIGLIGLVLPIILISIRSFRIGRKYGDTKASIRDSAFRWLIYGFFLVSWFILGPAFKFLTFLLMHLFTHPPLNFYISRALGTMSSMIIIIHFFTLVKLYRDEFKTQMIKA